MIGKKFKKITAALLSALIMLSALCVTVSAENIFEDSKEIKANTSYSGKLGNDGKYTYMYKIKVSESGDMVLHLTSCVGTATLSVYDSDGAEVDISSDNIKSGKIDGKWVKSGDSGIFKGNLTYKVKPGTYYFKIGQYWGQDSFKFYVTLPDSGDSSQTKISNTTIMLNMSAGDKIDLSAVKSGKVKSDATWSSSDKKIAKVSSKGVITAVKAGECTITWKSGSTSFSILVNVE